MIKHEKEDYNTAPRSRKGNQAHGGGGGGEGLHSLHRTLTTFADTCRGAGRAEREEHACMQPEARDTARPCGTRCLQQSPESGPV